MIEQATLINEIKNALTKCDPEMKYSIKLMVGKSNEPLKISINHAGKPEREGNLFIHNVSRGILIVCGTDTATVLARCIESWEDANAKDIAEGRKPEGKAINLANALFDRYYRNILEASGNDFSQHSTAFLIDRANRLTDGTNPESVIGVSEALRLFIQDTFDDEHSVNHIMARIDGYKSVMRMIYGLANHATINVPFKEPEESESSFVIEQVEDIVIGNEVQVEDASDTTEVECEEEVVEVTHESEMDSPDQAEDVTKKPAKEHINIHNNTIKFLGTKKVGSPVVVKMAEAMDITPYGLITLCQIANSHGTPRFIKAYEQHLEEDRDSLKTLAQPEDLQSLVDAIVL